MRNRSSTQVERATGDWQGLAESQLSLSEKVALKKRNHRSRSARMPRTGVRTVGCRREVRVRPVHTGIEDSVTENRQESLQALFGNLRVPVSHKVLLNKPAYFRLAG
jgi:hypothetical protein